LTVPVRELIPQSAFPPAMSPFKKAQRDEKSLEQFPAASVNTVAAFYWKKRRGYGMQYWKSIYINGMQ
jgi:hypothetical protein